MNWESRRHRNSLCPQGLGVSFLSNPTSTDILGTARLSPKAMQRVADLAQGGPGADAVDDGRHHGCLAACCLGDDLESLGHGGSGALRFFPAELLVLAFGQGRV